MMNKILITIKVPSLEKNYDIYIPISKNVGVTIELLVKTINELSGGHFPSNKKCILMSSTGFVYNNLNSTIKEYKIKNGDVLILI